MKLAKTDSNLDKIIGLMNSDIELKSDSKFMIRYNHSQGYGLVNDKELTDYLMLTICRNRIFTKRSKVALIDSYTKVKSKENLSKLLTEAIQQLRSDRIPLINVEPEDRKVYQELGFTDTVYQKVYQFNYKNIADILAPAGGNIKVGYWTDLIVQNGAAQLYEVPLHTSDERNTLNRPFWFWNLTQQINPQRKLAVYYGRVGLPVSYMFYIKQNSRVSVDELYSQNDEGMLGLMAYLKKIGDESNTYEILAPENSHYEDFISNSSKSKSTTYPFLMSRIVDFESVLSSMKPTKQLPFVVQVKDDQLCPWNNGNWQVEFLDDQVVVSKTEKQADFSGTISEWTKVLLGHQNLSAAILAGKIKQNNQINVDFEKGKVSFFEKF